FVAEHSRNERSPVVANIEQLQQYIAEIEAAMTSQADRLFDMRAKSLIARYEMLHVEPWAEVVKAVPGYSADGEMSGLLGIPSITAKEMFGTRLAFDLASNAGDEQGIRDTLNEYLDIVGDPENMMLVSTAALSTMATLVLPTLLEIVEQRGSNWDVRVNLVDAARNAWSKRVGDFEDDD
ncbi:hypothetical protein, partial [Prescottella equi]|uniref:hypothetical protein n=1 Tax=Rhodococcus hoagii TaxID=43767 RepID=UPI0007CD7371